MRLENKVVLITGAGSGIGREAALLFSSEGARIVVVDVNDDGGKETVKMIEAQEAMVTYLKNTTLDRMLHTHADPFKRVPAGHYQKPVSPCPIVKSGIKVR